MPLYRVEYKVSGRIKESTITAKDMDDAREQILSKSPGATITGVKEKQGGYQPSAMPAAKSKSSALPKLIGLLVVLAVVAAGAYFAAKHFGVL